MKQERIFINSVLISKPGQIKIFEVIIPRDVEQIIGIELGFKLTEGTIHEGLSGGVGSGVGWQIPLIVKRSFCAGEIRLQHFSKANLFYAGEILLDQNADHGNFTSEFFPPKVYSHSPKTEATKIKLHTRNRMIRGIYRDKLSESITGSYKYEVLLYLWVEKKKDNNETNQQK